MSIKHMYVHTLGALALLFVLLVLLNSESAFTQGEPTQPGEPQPNIIGNRVWCDDNADQMLSSGEFIPSVTIEISGQSTGLISTTVTDAEGNYLFSSLPADTYTVKVLTPTLPAACNVALADYDGGMDHMSTVLLDGITFTDNRDQDFGYEPPPGIVPGTGQIGNRVWCDADLSGDATNVNDISEKLADVMLMITNVRGYTSTTTTDDNGNYLFNQLGRGPYTIEVVTSTLPSACNIPLYDLDGGMDNQSSLFLATGHSDLNHDFGYQPAALLGAVGNKVWCDLDGDVTQDAGEGIGGVSIELRDTVAGIEYETVTLGGGSYLITNLPASSYQMNIDATTLPDSCNSVLNDPDTVPNGSTAFALAIGEINMSKDFGYSGTLPVANVGGQIWCDADGSNSYNSGEEIVALPVNLIDGSGGIFTINTDVTGGYLFENRTADTYTIRINPANLPSTCNLPVLDPDGVLDNETQFSFEPDADLLTLNFAYTEPEAEPTPTNTVEPTATTEPELTATTEPGPTATTEPELTATTQPDPTATTQPDPTATTEPEPTATTQPEETATTQPDPTATTEPESTPIPTEQTFATISGLIWDDSDGDGSRDEGEAAVAGVRIGLYNSNDMIIAPAITDENGAYSIPNVLPGSYYLKIELEEGQYASGVDIEAESGATTLFTVVAGQSKTIDELGVTDVAPTGQDDNNDVFLPLVQS
ncbi:MAG: SdrD B-like domain-containing protein [Chloroflexota bacterium]